MKEEQLSGFKLCVEVIRNIVFLEDISQGKRIKKKEKQKRVLINLWGTPQLIGAVGEDILAIFTVNFQFLR